METTPIKRRLTAILAADAVGYSRRMSEDEEGTLRQLAAHRAVIDKIIVAHEGRIVSTAGDSVLAEFPSSVEAVRCAVEMQDALETRNQAVPEAERLVFRIGVNLGDVMVDGADILGDGVNVAARLESIADPGGILISSSVYDQIAGKLSLGFTDIGEQSLKNITRPIRAYRFDRSGTATRPKPSAPRHPPRRGALIAAGAAVVAVAAVGAWQAGWFERRSVAPSESASAPTTPRPAEAASEETRVKLQIAEAERARAEAELARARAEADVVRQKAEAAKLSASRPTPATQPPAVAAPRTPTPAPAASTSAASTSAASTPAAAASAVPAAPPDAVSSAPSSAIVPPPPATASATAAAGTGGAAPAAAAAGVTGVAKWQCEAYDEIPSFSAAIAFRYAAGEYEIMQGSPGVPGYVNAKGAPAADGRLVLTGSVVARSQRFRGQKLPARFEGTLVGTTYDMRGTIGKRACRLQLPAAGPR